MRFRDNRRLSLCKHLPSIESACECAARHRKARFHNPEAVFIIDDDTGKPVDEARALEQEGTLQAAEPTTPFGPGLATTARRNYHERIRDARAQLEQALSALPRASGSTLLANTSAALSILERTERDLANDELLAQLKPRSR